MSRLSREAIKERLVQAIFDILDELDSSPQYGEMSTEKEAETIADAVFQVITETDDEDLNLLEFSEVDLGSTYFAEEHDETPSDKQAQN